MGLDRFFINFGLGPNPNYLRSDSEYVKYFKLIIIFIQWYFIYLGFRYWLSSNHNKFNPSLLLLYLTRRYLLIDRMKKELEGKDASYNLFSPLAEALHDLNSIADLDRKIKDRYFDKFFIFHRNRY